MMAKKTDAVGVFQDLDNVKPTKGLKAEIDDSIIYAFLKYVFPALLTFVLGALIATVWQLNGAIYQAVGKQSESGLMHEILKMKIEALEKSVVQKDQSLDCYKK